MYICCMKKSLANEVEWQHTPVKDKEFDKSRMEILEMRLEEYSQFCCRLSIEDVIILNGRNKQKIKQLKKKYGVSNS